MITPTGRENLAKTMKRTLGISMRNARCAIDANWMMLASTDNVDWRLARVEMVTKRFGSARVGVLFRDRLLATLIIDEKQVRAKTDIEKAMEEFSALVDQDADDMMDRLFAGDPSDEGETEAEERAPILEQLYGRILDILVAPEDERCLQITVMPADGSANRTLFMIPFLSETASSAYAEQLSFGPVRFLVGKRRDISYAPDTLDPDADVIEFAFSDAPAALPLAA